MNIHIIAENYSRGNCSFVQKGISDVNELLHYNSRLYFLYISAVAFCSISLVNEIKDFKILQRSYLARPFFYLLSCIILPIFFVILAFFSLISAIIDLYLKVKYGFLYGGMLSGGDAIWDVEDVLKNIINILVLVEDDNDKSHNFAEIIASDINKNFPRYCNDYPKIACGLQRSMGYTYLIKNQIDVSELVSFADNIIYWISSILYYYYYYYNDKRVSRSKIESIVHNYYSKPLPKENTALWEIIFFNQPIMYSDGKKKFPVLCRFNHVFGDGLSIAMFLSTIFGNKKMMIAEYLRKKWKHLIENKREESKYTKLTNIFYLLHALLMSPFVILHQNFLRRHDLNILHGPSLSGEKTMVFSVEEKQRLIPVLKKMKNELTTVKFSELILTALSGSLHAHFVKHSSRVPEFVTLAYPIVMMNNTEDLLNLKLQNKFSIAMLDLPVKINSRTMLGRLEAVRKQTSLLKKSDDFIINYFLVNKISCMIPQPILKNVLNTNNLTLTVSNLPDLPEITTFTGSKVRDILVFSPHRGNTGIGFTLLTHDNRLNLGLVVDKAILPSKEDAQKICNGVFIYIELLFLEMFGNDSHTNGKM